MNIYIRFNEKQDIFQINIVCGGYDNSHSLLDSCEVNVAGEDSWTITRKSLPVANIYLRGVAVDNRVFMTGKSSVTL